MGGPPIADIPLVDAEIELINPDADSDLEGQLHPSFVS